MPSWAAAKLKKAVPLAYLNEEFWQTSILLPPDALEAPLGYDYVLRNADGSEITDWGRDRLLVPSEFGCAELLVIDSWNDTGAIENVFSTEPFKKILLAANVTEVRAPTPVDRDTYFPGQGATARPGSDSLSARRWRGAGKLEHPKAGFTESAWRTKMI